MSKIHIITDSASDIVDVTREDLTVLPMTVRFGETEYRDGVNLTHHEFYEKLIENTELPVTSQIPPFEFGEAIREAKSKADRVLVITLSSKLSGTWQSACMAASEFSSEEVVVVDSENVTIGERILVEYALQMKDAGVEFAQIVQELETSKKKIHLVALLDTLEYLKKGGRISAAVALAGGLLSIKPVVEVRDGEVGVLGKARGSKQANNLMAEKVRAAGVDMEKPFCLGYTGNSERLIQKYIDDNEELWKDRAEELPIITVGATIGTHVGPGAIALSWFAE